MLRSIFAVAALATVLGACQPKDPLVISGAEFRPPLGSSNVGAGYVTLTSAKADRIVAVTSSKADSVEIHASVTEAGRASMQRLETVELPAGKPVKFSPGGMHFMVFSPHLDAGETTLPITVELQSGAKRTISLEYRRGGEDHHG